MQACLTMKLAQITRYSTERAFEVRRCAVWHAMNERGKHCAWWAREGSGIAARLVTQVLRAADSDGPCVEHILACIGWLWRRGSGQMYQPPPVPAALPISAVSMGWPMSMETLGPHRPCPETHACSSLAC